MKKILLISVLALLTILGKSQTAPVVTTNAITSTTRFTALGGGGNVTSSGGSTVTTKGVVWSTSANPTIALYSGNGKVTGSPSNGTGIFTVPFEICPLIPGVTYHYRAYATNAVGTSYGNDVTFATLPPNASRAYYFSSTTGNDNTGTGSITAPWRTLIKLQNLTTLGNVTFQPGDTICFKRGDVFNNGHNGVADINFQYVSCSFQCYQEEGYTAPSGTPGKPILITGYGTGANPNFFFPTASTPQYGSPIGHNTLEFVGVSWITLDGLQFRDTIFPATDKVNPAYTRSSLVCGSYQSGDNQKIPTLRKKMNSHFVIKNCLFANTSFGFHEIYCDTCEIGYNTFENFKSSIDTAGIHDVAAGAIDGLQGYYINIHHNTIKGSWAKSGRVSSTQGMVGVAMNTFLLLHSRIAYNTFIDNRHIIEIGNLDHTNSANGAQYDTIAYNKIINGSPNIIYLQPTTGPFAGNIKHLAFYNNTIVENQSSRQSGPNFGYDRDDNGVSFNQFWFFRNKNRATNAVLTAGSIPFGSHTMTMSSVEGISVGSRVYAPEGVPVFRIDPINPLNPLPAIPLVVSIVGNIVTIDSTALQSASGVAFTFYPPLANLGVTWSEPPNVSTSGNGGSWDNPNQDARPIQGVQNGDVTDTVIDIRNNIFYYTNGTQILYDNASHSFWKHSNNLYYLKGGYTYQTSTGATINNVTRLGSGATLGTNERIMNTKLFLDTTAALPENWNLRVVDTSYAVGHGVAIPGFTTDFAGNALTGTPTIGLFQNQVTILQVTSSYTPILCNGGNSIVTVSATGGTPPYTGIGTFSRGAGAYSYTVTDAASNSLPTTGTIPQPTTLTATVASGSISTYGGTTTSTVTAVGGTGTKTYSIDGGAYQSSNVFTGVLAGGHTAIVKDGVGCTTSVPFTLSQPGPLNKKSRLKFINAQ